MNLTGQVNGEEEKMEEGDDNQENQEQESSADASTVGSKYCSFLFSANFTYCDLLKCLSCP